MLQGHDSHQNIQTKRVLQILKTENDTLREARGSKGGGGRMSGVVGEVQTREAKTVKKTVPREKIRET